MVIGLKRKGCLACQFPYGNNTNCCSCFIEDEKEVMACQFPFGKLLQNSDLPLPVKIFKGEKESRLQSPAIYNNETEGRGDKLGLLKALGLSQTRAREAEKKASLLCIEKEQMAALFLRESWRLFAHRQWVKLLEMEVSHLRSQLGSSCLQEEKQLEEKAAGRGSNWWALALWLGIASVGLGLSCRCLFL